MAQPIIGWEKTTPVPDNHAFNHFLTARRGHLYMAEFELMQMFEPSAVPGSPLPSPLEVVYLPLIRERIALMRRLFDEAIAELGYGGRFHYAYASKANASEEVIRTTLAAGAHHEMSSTVDVEIARLMIKQGLLPRDRLIICNGFKPTGMHYADNIVRLQQEHGNVIPVIEDLGEIPPLLAAGIPFEVGLRQKCYGHHSDIYDMDDANSRFGMSIDDMLRAADYVAAAPNLTLRMYHGMVGSQILQREDFVEWLTPPMEMYARLRRRYPTLNIFNFGGGMPVPLTLDFDFDYGAFVRLLLTRMQEVCRRRKVPEPDIMGEFGRYTTAEHGAHVFRVVATKDNESALPWYIIDGSVMSSFPDAWALSEHFIVLPLNHLDKPFQRVQLGGITCDSDDVYPPRPSASPLYLPVETDELYVGFFSIGAYQEMLGGVRGSKHCLLPEAQELIIDCGPDKAPIFQLVEGQTADEVLYNLGYDV